MAQVSQQILVDKNKTPEQYLQETEAFYIVPKLVREKFPDLLKLIFETESMNVEEREYWLQIMPIMTEEQISKFRGILVNEKEQLAKLDKEYASEAVSGVGQAGTPVVDEIKMKEKFEEIKQKEAVSKEGEKKEEAELLTKLQNL